MKWVPWLVLPLSGCIFLVGPKDRYGYHDTWDYGWTDTEPPYSGTVGSPPTSGTSSVPGFSIVWVDDGLTPTDTDGDGIPDINCGDSLHITIVDPGGANAWSFGMAEGNSSLPWTGEDCFNGYGPFAHCHVIGTSHVIDEVPDCFIGNVVPGQTTLFDAEKDPFITYFADDNTTCFVRGFDPAYYAALGCLTML